MKTKRILSGLLAALFLTALAGGASAQEKRLWTKTKIKAKGEIYTSEDGGKHEGTGSVGMTCYHRTDFDSPEDTAPEVRQYCKQADGEYDLDDPFNEILPLPGKNFLAIGDLEADDDETKEIDVEGFFRILVERKKNGTPKSVSLRQRNALGIARTADPETVVVGGGNVKGDPVKVRDLPDLLQQIHVQRADLMLCGTSARDVSTFIPGGVELNVVNSCTPTADTQALLVSRNGPAGISDVVLQAYLNTGGIVITEYSDSDEVFNLAFTEAVTQEVSQQGGCSDNVNPEVQFTQKDPFWKAFDFVAESDSTSGCGFNMAAYPGITPLGGWADVPNSVSLAYRDLGDGRVWLVESDWQDSNFDFETSRRMMGYMIMHRR